MTGARCVTCGELITRAKFPFCPKCQLLVIPETDLDLSPNSPINAIYKNDDPDRDPNTNLN
jgi:hypothetical protein